MVARFLKGAHKGRPYDSNNCYTGSLEIMSGAFYTPFTPYQKGLVLTPNGQIDY